MVRYFIIIKGKVQGVSFRKSTRRIAEELRLKGWVKNLTDGSVSACVEGAESAVQALLAWCATGPERASVEGIRYEPGEYCNEFSGFEIRY
jgi:acylphosphatase